MPIDWSKAPEWARYVARDESGKWWWHSAKPQRNEREWMPRFMSEYWSLIERADIECNTHWIDSLTQRPKINTMIHTCTESYTETLEEAIALVLEMSGLTQNGEYAR